MNFISGNGIVFQALYTVTGMPKTAITISTPRSTPSTDADKAKDNGGNGAEETKDKEKKEGEGGGLYDLKTRKKIQTFLEVYLCFEEIGRGGYCCCMKQGSRLRDTKVAYAVRYLSKATTTCVDTTEDRCF